MADVIAAIQNAIDIVGKLRALAKKVEDAEFKMLLADLSGDLADAKLEVANLKIELAKAKEEAQRQAALLAQRTLAAPTVTEGAYKFEGEDGLFCTACFDTKQQKVRVTPLTGAFKTFGKWRCPSCRTTLA